MKIAVLVLATLAVAHAAVVPTKSTRRTADSEFLKRQKNILSLLIGVGHEKTFTNEYEDFDFASHVDHYTDPQVVKNFTTAYKHGFLPKDGVFTLACKKTRYQTIKLFDLFFFAKDFETFYKSASWARKHVNGIQFTYALYVAVYHRPDCHGFNLPPIYEVFPHAFITSDLLHKFYDAKMEGLEEYKVYVNNSGWENYWHKGMFHGVIASDNDNYYQHTEERMSYFREDVGLSDYLAQFSAFYPSWLNQEKYYKVKYFRRGEMFYYIFQQLFARYSLERFANNMPNTEVLLWDKPIKTGYNPNMINFNGRAYFARPDNMVPETFNPFGVHRARQYERRIYEAIDLGSVFYDSNGTFNNLNVDGVNYLGFAIQGAPESPSKSYYGSYFYKALEALGYMVKTGSDKDFVSGAVGNLITASRDPAFYQFLHRFVKIFQYYKKQLPYYTESDLYFPGVKVESFQVDKLVTYFDRFDFEVNNAVPVHGEKSYKDYHYVAKQFRLNHKPFTYKLTVTSDKSTDAMVRVFIGPKYDSEGHEMTVDQARMAFVEFDRFPTKLTNGQNIFERNSKESTAFVEDAESFRSYYERVKESLEKQQPFYVTESFRCGMPDRFMLPKGWKAGQPFVMYAIVTPYEEKYTPGPEERYFDSYVLCGGSKYYDNRAYGFPFDRQVPHPEEFHYPNMYFKDITVYHKDEADVNRVVPDHV